MNSEQQPPIKEQPIYFVEKGRTAKLARVNDKKHHKLFASADKIYVRHVKGYFQRWRLLFLWITQIIFFVTPWLNWNGRQAVWLDLDRHQYFFFGLVLGAADTVFLALILILSALGLFLFTAVAGRLWCGYSCPQTVYTAVFMWVERNIEGDYIKRRRLDKDVFSAEKWARKIAKHLVWIVLALLAGYTLVGYFTPIRQMLHEILTNTMSYGQIFWILLYSGFMYLFAGFMREQVCTYMCPYARFQSVMFDKDTLIVSYDKERGEPRGARAKSADFKLQGKGSCIDCGVCVDVCPTGIDIRDGLQYECIGCGACIDACDQIMDKMQYPRGLIRYISENAMAQHVSKPSMWRGMLRPRVLVYSATFLALMGFTTFSILKREAVKIVVERDRSAASLMENGEVMNTYKLDISNLRDTPYDLTIKLKGINGAHIVGQHEHVKLKPFDQQNIVVKVSADLDGAKRGGATSSGSNGLKWVFDYQSPADSGSKVIDNVFLLPKL